MVPLGFGIELDAPTGDLCFLDSHPKDEAWIDYRAFSIFIVWEQYLVNMMAKRSLAAVNSESTNSNGAHASTGSFFALFLECVFGDWMFRPCFSSSGNWNRFRSKGGQ